MERARRCRWTALRSGAALLAFATGCRGSHHALNPAGQSATQISNLWWFFFLVTATVYLLVLIFLVAALLRFGSPPGWRGDKQLVVPQDKRERRISIGIGVAVGATILLLFVLLIADVYAGTSLHSLGSAEPLSIKLTGHQWWWDVQYNFPVPSNIVTTANEIHIPVGKPVQFQLQSYDVIHSFWVPNLTGKKDLIPGHPTALWLQADRTGTFFGQCAEFCGYQHAHMRLVVVAESSEEFDQWLQQQRQSPPPPATDRQKRGQEIFLSGPCVMCHKVQGTIAGARLGPDLTHFASRQILAAGRLKNNRGNLGGWILDPQHLKPGVHMPQNQFESEDFHALLDYLETLK